MSYPDPPGGLPLDKWMDNVLAARLGGVARSDRSSAGDDIDRGLMLLRQLKDAGFELRVRAATP